MLYKEKINYKYPGGGGYAAHQDAPAYEFIKFHITCLISVDSATPESGCLYFAPGRHKEGFIALDEKGCVAPETAARMEWVAVPTDPGDILLFGSYIPHKSPGNRDTLSISPTMPVPKGTGASSITQTSGELSCNTQKTAQTETNRLAKSHTFKGDP